MSESSSKNDGKTGKKVLKFLPENFFEKVLDLELKLKRDFHLSILEELVNLYSIAIEYYESNNNQKHLDYQTRLKLLLSQPEIIKKMNKEKLKSLQNKDKSADAKPNRFLQLQEKKYIINNYKSKVNSIGNSDNEVNELMKNFNKTVGTDDLINKEINKQESSFKSRLEEKRKSRMLSTSSNDLKRKSSNSPTKVLNKSGVVSSNAEMDNKSQNADINSNVENNRDDKSDLDLSSGNNNNAGSNNNLHENEKILENIEDIFEKINNNENEDSKSIEGRRQHNSMFNIDHAKLFENFDENKIIGSKNKKMIVGIKYSTENFLTGFNGYFHENVFQKFTEHIEKLMDEKYKKYLEISKNYNTQIKEMEFLANSDENQHMDSIKDIINSLREEQQHEFDRIEDYYGKLIKEAHNNFKNVGFRNNKGIQILEEKFKLDIYNLIKDTLEPAKK